MKEQMEMFVKCDYCGNEHAKWGNVRKVVQLGSSIKTYNYCDDNCFHQHYLDMLRREGL